MIVLTKSCVNCPVFLRCRRARSCSRRHCQLPSSSESSSVCASTNASDCNPEKHSTMTWRARTQSKRRRTITAIIRTKDGGTVLNLTTVSCDVAEWLRKNNCDTHMCSMCKVQRQQPAFQSNSKHSRTSHYEFAVESNKVQTWLPWTLPQSVYL